MRFSTFGNDIIDKEPTPKERKRRIIIGCIMLAVVFIIVIIVAIILSVKYESIVPAVFIIGSFLVLILFSLLGASTLRDYVEIKENEINVVEFYIFGKKEQHFTLNDIKYAKIEDCWDTIFETGYGKSPPRTRSGKYIIFRGHNNEYLFKMKCSRKRKAFWEEYVEFDNIILF